MHKNTHMSACACTHKQKKKRKIITMSVKIQNDLPDNIPEEDHEGLESK